MRRATLTTSPSSVSRHLFVEGEYVTVTEHDGLARPFRVVRVAPAVVRD
jgi:hypothetical protein